MTKLAQNSIRTDLLACFNTALQAVNGQRCVVDYFSSQANLPETGLALVAIGKAAVAMTEGAISALGARIEEGLVITKAGYAVDGFHSHPQIELIESAHPLPNERSLVAGQRLLVFLQGLPEDRTVLFLISGGTSALVEVLPEGLSLAELQAMNAELLAGGMTINEINRVRKRVSLIKGGGLLHYLGERPVLNLLLSDVPDNDTAVIGSGLLDMSQLQSSLPDNLPARVKNILTIQNKPSSSSRRQTGMTTAIIGDNQTACQAAAIAARDKGYQVHVHAGLLTANVNAVSGQIIEQLQGAEAGIHIWGGEPTVCLPVTPGRGGRNQQLALLLAERISLLDNIYILVAATDGSDGPGEDAGGLIDGQTILRGEQAGFNAQQCLQQANAGTFLEASGDLVSTGPTGSNVMDLIIACKT